MPKKLTKEDINLYATPEEKELLKEDSNSLPVSSLVTDEILEEAQGAFWAKIAASYPMVKTGDFDPGATVTFDDACKKAVETWLMWNHPDLQKRWDSKFQI